MTTNWQVAHMNIATALYPKGDARIEEFYSRIDSINELADRSPGFIWRFETGLSDPDSDQGGPGSLLIVNMSVWQSIEAVADFAYRTAHQKVMAKRRKWFERPTEAYQVLWWVPDGHRPTVAEGMERLQRLRSNGPTEDAFSFKTAFPAPGSNVAPLRLPG
jgi:heme-degrading monooxygenase HmoA